MDHQITTRCKGRALNLSASCLELQVLFVGAEVADALELYFLGFGSVIGSNFWSGVLCNQLAATTAAVDNSFSSSDHFDSTISKPINATNNL
jgi:hypothetical protein